MGLKFFKLLIFFCCIVYAVKTKAYPPDTMVVFEYVHITDTIWTDNKPELLETDITLLKCSQFDELKTQLKPFPGNNCATIPNNNIILSNQQVNNDNMKKLTLLGLTLFTLNSVILAQNVFKNTLGIYLKGNAASQIHWYPGINQYIDYFYGENPTGYINEDYYTEEEFGRYATNKLLSMGIGICYEHTISKRFSLVSNIGYLQRGSSEGKTKIEQENYNGTVILTEIQKKENIFHNATVDIRLKWRNKNKRNVIPYLFSGLRVDYTLARNIEYQIDKANPFPESSYKDFNRLNYGIVYGAGLSIMQNFYVETEINNDIGYLVNNNILKVRNTLFSINIGYKFLAF